MSTPFLGEVRPWACNFAPRGWAICAGQILAISQYTALFSLLGTYYGGNGTTNFGLPDLRGRVPMKYGQYVDGTQYMIGEQAGVETVTLQSATMPVHTHTVFGTSASATNIAPNDGTVLASHFTGLPFYAAANSPLTTLNPGTVSLYQGGNLPHSNIQPYLAINWCIALEGIFPSRN